MKQKAIKPPSLVRDFSQNNRSVAGHFKKRPEEYWKKRGEKDMLALFQEMRTSVPAYKSFLKKHKFSGSNRVNAATWAQIPVTDKKNYLTEYPTEDLCRGGNLEDKNWTIASTSGSTGVAYYFPRTHAQDLQFAMTADAAFREIFETDKHSTLFVNCFALGVWIGGMFMAQTLKLLTTIDGHRLTVINPGADPVEALKAIKALGPKFSQVIIGGYAPLVKDLIDRGSREGVRWGRMRMKYFFAAEGFTEGFRDYLKKKGGMKDIYHDAMNHYGTADMGTMANETPVSIFIRRYARAHPKLNHALFGRGIRQPTLCQYVPELYYFEEVDGRLLCSGNSGLPLVRYDLKDVGGVLSWNEITQAFKTHTGKDLHVLLRAANLLGKRWKLPFVYVHERNDFTISIYSVNIYPDSIHRALGSHEFEEKITGKFTMLVDYDKNQDQYWEIITELQPNVDPDEVLKNNLLDAVVSALAGENSEWKDFYDRADIHKKMLPRITLRNYQDPDFFSGKGKHRWVKKT